MVISELEIWRSIALLDYDFFLKDAIDEGNSFVVSLDRLLLMRVCAMDVEKYKKDLITMKEYYYKYFRNQEFLHEAETYIMSYDKSGGIIFGGKYMVKYIDGVDRKIFIFFTMQKCASKVAK